MGYVGNKADSNYSSIDKQVITGNGGTGYTLSHSVANANEIEVFVNNVRQDPGVAYTVNNAALTMTGAVANTDSFYVVFIGKAVQTKVPADGSVGTAKIANAAVSTTKIADGAVTAAKIAAGAVSVVAVQATAPSSPAQGDMWFNTSSSIASGISSKALAVYNGTAWQKSTTGIGMTATGGIKRTSGLYTYHTFTSSGTFSVSQTGGVNIDSLVIAGGGGGGHDNGGGGGAGGVVWTTSASIATGNYTVTVGAGGAPSAAGGINPGANGANSIFRTATALGGGGAGGAGMNGANGGSGGGGSRNYVGGAATQGASGGTAFANRSSASTNSASEGGGGGGAGAAGTAGTSGALGSGGIGVSTFVNSSATETTAFLIGALAGTDSSNVATTSFSSGILYIAGGGAGGSQNSGTPSTTAAGGGAPSVANTNSTGANALVNTGSGGGSSGTGSGTGGSGGSGIVIVRYLT